MFMATIIGLAVVDQTFRAELARDCDGTLERYHFGPLSRWERDQVMLLSGLLGRADFGDKLEAVHRDMCPVWPVCCDPIKVSRRRPDEKA